MDRWRTDRRSLVLDTRASQYLGRLLCSGPPPASAENSPWKLSDSFTQSRERPTPSSPRPPRQTPRRRTRSSSAHTRRPVSAGPLLDESYAETASFIQSRYHGKLKRMPQLYYKLQTFFPSFFVRPLLINLLNHCGLDIWSHKL